MKRTLILNADYRPLSIVNARRGLLLSLKNAEMRVIAYYNDYILSEKNKFAIPAVIAYPRFIKYNTSKIPTKKKILSRDGYICQYCSLQLNSQSSTIDHIIPVFMHKNKKDANTWENMVACCKKCNSKKGDKLLEFTDMQLIRQPKRPNYGINLHNPPVEWMEFI